MKILNFISDEEALAYQKSSFVTIKTDKMPVYDKGGNFLFYSRVGAILPVLAQDDKNYYGKIYVRNMLREFVLPKSFSALFHLNLMTQI
ncbi:SH3 domain-containing protein [Campylobacter concisus]